MNQAPLPSTRFRRRLRYWVLLGAIGMLANALAVTAPGSVPLMVGNLAPLALALRLPPIWALSSAVLVGGVLPDHGWWLFTLLQTGTVCLLRARGRERLLTLAAAQLAVLALPAAWLLLRAQGPFLEVVLGGLTLLLGALIALLGAAQVNLLARSPQQHAASSLVDRLAASMSVASTIPLGLILLLINQGLWRSEVDALDGRLQRAARLMADDIHSYLDVHSGVIAFAAAETRLPDRLPRLDALQAAFPGYLTLLLSDAGGRIVHFHAPQATGFGGDVSDRPYFRLPRSNGQPYVSPVFQGRGFGNDMLVAVSAPHRDADGRFAGVVQGALSLQVLGERLLRRVAPAGLGFTAIDAEGHVVASSDPGLLPLSDARQPRLLPGGGAHGLRLDQSGEQLIRAASVTGYGWRMVSSAPLQPLRERASRQAALLAAGCLLLMFLLPRQARRFAEPFVRPLRELVERIRDVDLDHTDTLRPLAMRVESSEHAELLADFNSMLARLLQLNEQLRSALARGEQLNQELEQKVIERTLELSDALHRAEELARGKSRFLANMSHELRTPLTAILGYTDLALREPDNSTRWRDALDTINRNGKHLLGIVNDVLDASRIDAGQMVLEAVEIAPVAIIDEVVRLFEANARERGIALECILEWPLPAQIEADPLRLRQVLINLIGNAIKFTERGGVQVHAWASADDGLQIAVHDSGVGMTEEQVARLFRAFEQADASTTRRFGGSGLGLYICGELARAMGGRIEVESTPGSGSCFTLVLPLPTEVQWIHERPLSVEQGPGRIPALAGEVLVVDDVADLRHLVERLVESTGAQASGAEDGRRAVELALSGRFELVLMDMHMPHLDGRDATRELRRLGYRGPIVALTADVLREDVEAALRAGCDEVLGKPVEAPALYAALERHLPAAAAKPAKADEALHLPAVDGDVQRRLQEAMAAVRKRFAEQLEGEIAALQNDHGQGRDEALARRLHTLKGSAGTFGFMAISRAAAVAEKALRGGEGDWPAAWQSLLDSMQEARRAG